MSVILETYSIFSSTDLANDYVSKPNKVYGCDVNRKPKYAAQNTCILIGEISFGYCHNS